MLKIISLISKSFYDELFNVDAKNKVDSIGTIDFSYFSKMNEFSDLEFSELLNGFDVILGGWGTRSMPSDYVPVKDQLFCMTTGTVTSQLKPKHLEEGLRATNWGDAISQYISESALMQILSSLRKVGAYYQRTHIEKSWGKEGFDKSQSLFYKKVGLLGCGIIAQKLIPLLKPFNVEIMAYDPYIADSVLESLGVRRAESVKELFSTCTIISNHLAKTEETNDLINADMMALLPDNGVIVNTARGNSIDEIALAKEHQKGRLWSSLDVFKTEPLEEESLLRNEPRCLILCHQAGPTDDGYFKMGERAAENIFRFYKKSDLLGELTPQKLKLMT